MHKILNKKILLMAVIFLIIVLTVIYYFFHSGNKDFKIISSIPQTVSVQKDQEGNEPVKNQEEVVKLPSEPKPIPLPVGTDRFIVALKDVNENIANNLLVAGYIADKDTFMTLLSGKSGKESIIPGGYKISKEMNPSQLVQVLKDKPYMKWIVVPEGLRKEEIAKLLADSLGWSSKQKDEWIKVETATKPEYMEGVYFPDTYLIPIDEPLATVANRLISKFNDNFAPLLPLFTAKNIKWTTAITFASIVQRETANDADTPLIAGILWNRLNQNMSLGVDATLQYIRGDKGNGWWAPISVTDKKTDSPYNTYIHTGLPPHPISNPGLPAIEAVLNPTKTDCLYYLHDKNRVTHCAATYEEHQANIEKYLKNN